MFKGLVDTHLTERLTRLLCVIRSGNVPIVSSVPLHRVRVLSVGILRYILPHLIRGSIHMGIKNPPSFSLPFSLVLLRRLFNSPFGPVIVQSVRLFFTSKVVTYYLSIVPLTSDSSSLVNTLEYQNLWVSESQILIFIFPSFSLTIYI